jgi:hypothetical protein
MDKAIDPPLGAPPRKASYRRGIRNARRGYRTLFALVILVFAGWAALDGFRWYDLAYRVRTVVGKVTGKHGTTQHEYRLEYEFTAEGDRITDSTAVPQAVHDAAKPGDPCTVVYLPGYPKIDHWLFDNDAIRTHLLYLTIGHGLIALLAVFALRFIERPLRRELRLARRGEVATGELVAIRPPRRKRGLNTITYRFRTAAGIWSECSCKLPRRVRIAELAVGTSLEVLYDPRFPRRNKPRLAFDHVDFGTPIRKRPASP